MPVPNLDQRLQYPRLKSGVSLEHRGTESFLGLPMRGIVLTDPMHLLIARRLDGVQSTGELARGLLIPITTVQEFIQFLSAQGLIDMSVHPHESIHKDMSRQFIAMRSAHERELASHRPGSSDGGVGELASRASMTILISGENRLARNLLVALHASGFTQTRLISRSSLPARISTNDVCGIAVRASDIGRDRKEFTEELIRNAQISRSEAVAQKNPDLIISTLPLEWDYVQRWMSEGSTHLHISPLIGSEIEIGPLVIPGITPCLRCVTLIKRENGTVVDQEYVRGELPSGAIAFLSGLIVLAVAEFNATGGTPLRAASYWYNLLEPMCPAERRHWSFHPSCGCLG